MNVFTAINATVRYLVVTVILFITVLMILRLIVNYKDMNPFGAFPRNVKRFSDPLVDPVRRWLMFRGFNPKIAPLITLLVIILAGWLALSLVWAILFTANGVFISIKTGMIVSLIGCLLYGFLSVYSLLILIRIVLSWMMVYGNRWTRFVTNATEPILGPFRRLIPPFGGFDFSPVIVMLIIQFFQSAVLGTLIPNAAMFAI